MIRRLRADEIQTALEMIWKVFLQYEAPDYAAQGVRSFRSNLDDKEKIGQLTFYGETLVGTICLTLPQHIGGFFVRGEYHRRAIGRAGGDGGKMRRWK